jgi:2,4-dienoyl-CoA reductase (NADPH2)
MSRAGSYPLLLSPLVVGAHTLKNRVIMGSMHTRIEQLDRSLEREIAFYVERAHGGVALIVTAGCSPNDEGRLEPGAHALYAREQLDAHRELTAAVRTAGSAMILQILHAGRYAKHDQLVGPSAIRAPINPRTPRALSESDIERTLGDYVRCAELASEAGYLGVEVMGSEGYLITQFAARRSNDRQDRWGGSLENRCRFGIEVVRRIRERLGRTFLLMFRISALDLVTDGLAGDEIELFARRIEAAGADALTTGIGWHEAPVPTISYQVPRGAWLFAARRLKSVVKIPIVATNRINTPELAEQLIADGAADLVALARPLLADAEFVLKAAANRADEINTCIACNQACLDQIFANRSATCLVNPRAGREIDFPSIPIQPALRRLRVAVVGAGPAGLACAVTAAQRRHNVVLYDSASRIGGQLNLAARVPGKGEFRELLRYFDRQLELHGVDRRLGVSVNAASLAGIGFDHIVIATGVEPRRLSIPGADHPMVMDYADLLSGRRIAGVRVAIVGAGGIGFDVAEFLATPTASQSAEEFLEEWGVDTTISTPGGLRVSPPATMTRQLTLLQRSEQRFGRSLGISTGWVLRSQFKRRGIVTEGGCRYQWIDDRGLHYQQNGQDRVAAADTIVVCAGQEPVRRLADEIKLHGISHTLIGGALVAAELDAMRAIDEGTRLAFSL